MSVVESVRQMMLGGTGVTIDWDTVDPVPLTQRQIFDLLSSDRRRLVLSYLVLDGDGFSTIANLAEYIAGVENGVGPKGEPTSAQRKRVYVGLYQTHLPKLHEAGVIDWDSDRGEIHAEPTAVELVKLDRGVSRVSAGVPR